MDDLTETSGSELPPTEGSAELALIWVAPAEEQRVTVLQGPRLSIGRGDDADIHLDVREVSRRHAELRRSGPLWLVADAGSKNGVFVDGHAIREAPLGPGVVLRVGDAVAIVAPANAEHLGARFAKLDEELYGGGRFAAALADARRVAASPLSMVIEGETGSGKEQVACAVHRWSRREGPLVAVNCAALPAALAESELFGHAKGAFTGADRAHTGYLRSAQRGSLFLDEVLELPLPLQAKLLRVLETREVTPLGETRPIPLDLRIICATQRPLKECVSAGTFRADLMARLAEFRLVLPPLRDRREDVPGLFRHFLRAACGGTSPALSAKLVEALCVYRWPLNVRELRSVARQVAVLHSHERELGRRHLPSEIGDDNADSSPPTAARNPKGGERDARDLELLLQGLRSNDGHLARACEVANISRQRAQRLLARHRDRDPRR